MNAIAPVWDGNETWLVLGGGGLLAAFPLAYAIILPALYAPLIAMLLGLVFRGVAFEFRWRDPGHRRFWDAGFFARLAGRDLRAGRDAGRAAAGHHRRGPRLCRRLVGLAVAVQPADRRRPGGRLCPARRLLADLEDRGRAAGRRRGAMPAGSRPALLVAIGAVSLATLVRSSRNITSAGSTGPGLLRRRCRCRCWSPSPRWLLLAQPRARPRLRAVPAGAGPVRAVPWSGSASRSGPT